MTYASSLCALLFDPQAGSLFLGTFDFDSAPFDWGAEANGGDMPGGAGRPNYHLKDLVIYEMPVRSFTADPSSGLDEGKRGSFLGVAEKVRGRWLGCVERTGLDPGGSWGCSSRCSRLGCLIHVPSLVCMTFNSMIFARSLVKMVSLNYLAFLPLTSSIHLGYCIHLVLAHHFVPLMTS